MPDDAASPVESTLVVPTYNAIEFIDSTAARLRRFVDEHANWCVLFVCDGCTDGTPARLRSLIADEPRLRMESYEPNRGKGYALRVGLSNATTQYRIYTDVDLAYDPEQALKILDQLKAGADLALVNRIDPQSCYLISPRDFPTIYRRHIMSRCFSWWLRKMLPIRVRDTQAGLKGLTAPAWNLLAGEMTSDRFFFDVELLSRAMVHQMTIRETPVLFRYVDPTTVRMISNGWDMIFETIKLRKSLRESRPAKDRDESAKRANIPGTAR